HDDGHETKNFHSRDGHGIKMMLRAGVEAIIITGRTSRVVELRAKDLGITELHQKVTDKWPVFEEALKRRGLTPAQAAFAGDDVVDLPVMLRVGLAMAPADACPEVKAAAHFISTAPGGRGAAREMVEFLLKGQGRWEELMKKYYA
ncbi:HAD hydrolase family protein, partial [Deltaproteobacteria bacterium OttesenSCG-928-K17]|nr:HAD hydrolase family protein [Deltaproteobacteria bacterium OttesenSCG-928-K17]